MVNRIADKNDLLRLAAVVLAVFAATYYASEIGLTANKVVALWPAAGISLWACWRFGVAGAIASFIAFWGYGIFFIEEFNNVLPSLGNAVAAWLGAQVLHKNYDATNGSPLRNLTWILLAGGLLSVISAVVGGTHLATFFGLNSMDSLALGLRWFLSDIAGVVLTAPFLFALSQSKAPLRWRSFATLEVGLAVLLALSIYLVLDSGAADLSISATNLLMASPFVFWVMTRRQTESVLLAMSVVGLASLTFAARLLNHDNATLLESQLFMLTFLTAGLYIHELLKQISAAKTELEDRVERRTHQLLEAKQRAESADRAKSQFLATTSHEVRTPMNGVLGMAELLAQTDLDEQQRGQVQTIISSGKSLLSLLNDVIDLSKVEAGRLEINPIPVYLPTLLEEVNDLWAHVATDKGVDFRLTISAGARQWFDLDPVRVKQCLSNLISNAIKFTHEGAVSVEVNTAEHPHAEPGRRHDVTFKISDSGIGMAGDSTHKLFQPFTQLNGSITRRYGGTGLGLTITKNLIEMMGGQIEVASVENEGSTFTVTVPLLEAAAGQSAGHVETLEDQTKPAKPVRTLLVEDNPVNRMVAHGYLKNLGPIDDAEHGLECLTKLRTNTYDLVLLDIHMPVMDGVETIKHIRQSSAAWQNIPVIALTADAMSEDRNRLLSLGMNGYASKPIDKQALLNEIQNVMSAAVTHETQAAASP